MQHPMKLKISKKIPVVFATDDRFVVPAYVAICSMLKNSSTLFFYDIYIFYSESLSGKSRDFLLEIEKKYKNCGMQFQKVDGHQFEDVRFDGNITGTAMFRLLISDYLPEYDRCLYFDGDIIVLGDISELYAFPMGEDYIAAVKDGGVQCYFEKYSEHAKDIDIKSMKSYVNSGVLVMNLKEIREKGMKEVFLSHVGKQYQFPDQDILNTCCEGRIKYLPLKYNVFRRFYQRTSWLCGTDFSEGERKEAEESPVILHYSEGLKPWDHMWGNASDIWWKYALEALPGEVYHRYRKCAEERLVTYDWRELERKAAGHENVVIFGFSHYGKKVLKILDSLGIKNIAAFCDNALEKRGLLYEGIRVEDIETIMGSFQKVLFINTSQRREKEVLRLLLEKGCVEEDIWNYRYRPYVVKSKPYYELLDKKYYAEELRGIILFELDIVAESWDILRSIAEKEENRFLRDKYYMDEWVFAQEPEEVLE